jgi:heterodisulfide reductase subunit C
VDDSLQQEIKVQLGVDVETCLECGKCSGGCSNVSLFDITPRQIIKLIRLGTAEPLLKMDALWTCVACQLCIDRCPSGIDIPRIMDYLRARSCRSQVPATREHVKLFHELMLDHIENSGRVIEGRLALVYNFKTGNYFKDVLDLGMPMVLQGKVKPFGKGVKKRAEVRRIFQETMQREGQNS